MTRSGCARRLVLFLLAGCLTSPSAATEIVGDGANLWVVQPFNDQQIMILHRGITDPAHSLFRAFDNPLNGRITDHGVASTVDRLWLVYEDLSVQSISREATPGIESAVYRTRTQRQLPDSVVLRSLTVGDAGPWALVGVSDGKVLAKIDGATVEDEAAPQGDDVVEVDRLLQLGGQGWQPVDLPEPWPHAAPAWVVMPRATSRRPLLFAAGRDGGLEVYRPDEQGWTQSRYPLDAAGRIQIAAMQEGQLVVAQGNDDDPGKLIVNVSMLRGDGLRALGAFVLDSASVSDWRLVPGVGAYEVGLVSWDQQDSLSITQMNLQGNVAATQPLKVVTQPVWPGMISMVVMVLMLALATLIMFAYWWQDPAANRPDLPAELALGDLMRRGAAALIDLGPIVAVIIFAYDVKLHELISQWSAPRSGQGTQILASLIGMGVFFLHTFVTELFTARSLGKALMGLRVANLSGRPPTARQVFIRNIMKPLELYAWPLLMMPLISPNRQRLGDMAARTVIVSKAQSKQDDG